MTNNNAAHEPFASSHAYDLHPITHNCDDCFDYAGHENTHSDDDHEGATSPDPDCRVCQHDFPRPLKGRVTVAKASTGHINHSACYAANAHDKSREGRQLCRDAGTWLTFATNV
jgi:hypothetical protein